MAVLARHHEVTAIYVDNPAEMALPEMGWIEWVDPETGRHGWARSGSSVLRSRFNEARMRQKQLVFQTLRRVGVDALDLSTAADVVGPLVSYFRARARRRTA